MLNAVVLLFPNHTVNMMYTTSSFCTSLVNSIIGYMTENRVDVLPMSFLASGENGFPETAKIARDFITKGHWDYFFVRDGKLWLHTNYNGYLGLEEYDDEILPGRQPMFNERRKRHILTADLVALVRVAYDTIGNANFTGRGVDTYDTDEIDELEAKYEARRNEVA